MGTPKKNLFEAMRFFRSIGHEGIEVRVAADGQINPETYTPQQGKDVVRAAEDIGIRICCLTSYYNDFVSPEKRDTEIGGLKRIAEMAAELGCPLIRAMGGKCNTREKRAEVIRARSIEGLQVVADHAARLGVKLAVETHIGFQCLTAGATADFVRTVDRPNVGILLDYAWVHYAGAESAVQALKAVGPYLLHCHVKDWKYVGGDREKRHAVLMGKGDVDWPVFLSALKAGAYSGYVSDEYEKYWHDHLPEPEVGMAHNVKYLCEALSE